MKRIILFLFITTLAFGQVDERGRVIQITPSDSSVQIPSSATNYLQIETDGTLEFNGDATVWDDIRVPLTKGQVGAGRPPSFETFIGAVLAYAFEDEVGGQEDQIYFTVQIPHSYKEGTDLCTHIHWSPKENPADADHDTVRWALEYEWANINGTYGGTTTIDVNAGMDATDAKKHIVTEWTDISGSGMTISSILMCRLYRDSGDGDDSYDGKSAFALEIDFHYEIDTIGSRQEKVK